MAIALSVASGTTVFSKSINYKRLVVGSESSNKNKQITFHVLQTFSLFLLLLITTMEMQLLTKR